MANRYWVGGNGNWDADKTGKWALTSGGTPGENVPTSSDAVFLDNGTGHGDVTITAAAVCASLNCTGYTGVLRFQATLTVSGAVTFASTQATMTCDNPATRYLGVTVNGGTTVLTSGGKVLPCGLSLGGSSSPTYTLADAWVLTGALGNSTGVTLNGASIRANGLSPSTGLGGNTTITLGGGTWSGGGGVAPSVVLDGNVTVSGSVKKASGGSITKTSGTITTTGSTLEITGAVTIDTPGVVWNNINYTGSTNALTLNSLVQAAWLGWSATSTPSWLGPGGFTVGWLSLPAPTGSSRVATFSHTATFTVTNDIAIAGSSGLHWTLTADTGGGGARTPFVLQAGATQNLSYVNATRLNSSAGQQIQTLLGTVSECDNWAEVTGAPAVNLIYRQKASV